MTPAEQTLDRALAFTALPSRTVPLDLYALDPDDTPSVQAAKAVAVRMAKLDDEESCLFALQHAQAHAFGYSDTAKGRAA